MRIVKIKTGKKEFVKCNYTKTFFELMKGMFADSTKPLLMEINFLLRPTIITTNSRRGISLPVLDILTFDKKFNLIRRLEKIPNEKNILMKFREKYILEIPHLKTPRYRSLAKIKKLKFKAPDSQI